MKIVEILSSEEKESSLKRLEVISRKQGWGLQIETELASNLASSVSLWLEQYRNHRNQPPIQPPNQTPIHLVRLDVESSVSLLSSFPERTNTVNILEGFDHLIFDKKNGWPHLLVFEALRLGMMHKVRAIDTLSCGYVVGSNELGMISAAVLIGMGIRKIYWLGEDLEFLKEKMQRLLAHYVGVEIKIYPAATITTLSEKGSVLLCAMNLSNKRDLLADLLYFNYIKKGGLVGSLVAQSDKDTFLMEAEKAELAPLSAQDLNMELDWQVVMKLGLSHKMNFMEFQKIWLQADTP